MEKRGGIKPLTALFEKYTKTLIAPQSTIIETAVEVIEDVCGFTVSGSLFRYQTASRTLIVQAPGPQKTEIILHKTEILVHIEGRIGSKNTPKNIL